MQTSEMLRIPYPVSVLARQGDEGIKILPETTTFFDGFDEFASRHVPYGGRIIDIGAGAGGNLQSNKVRSKVKEIVGVDPDSRLEENKYIDEAHRCTIEEFSTREPRLFDAAIGSFVVEHIDDPVEFLKAAKSRLRPGAAFILATPNLWHYFGILSLISQTIGAQDLILRILGKDPDSYHFPTRYQMNTVTAIRRAAGAAGFGNVEIYMFDNHFHLSWYFPKQLRFLPRVYSRLVHMFELSPIMATMFVVMR